MSFTKLKQKSNGLRTRVDLQKVTGFNELESGTELMLDNGATLVVEESFQTVSNRAAKGEPADEVTGTPAPAL